LDRAGYVASITFEGAHDAARLRRLARAGTIGSLVFFLLAASADADPQPRVEQVRLGFTTDVRGVGCTRATLSRRLPSDRVVRVVPAAGATLAARSVTTVTGVGVIGRQAVWTVAPTQGECDLRTGTSNWRWRTGEQLWTATYLQSVRAIRATRWNGLLSIAGLRVNRSTGAATSREARRYFGPPSRLRRGDALCWLHWRRLGLAITFASRGDGDPCIRGVAHRGRVRGGTVPWTAIVGRRPGVALGTTAAYLENLVIGGRHSRGRAWTLAERYLRGGDGAMMSAVSARLDRRDHVVGFEFRVHPTKRSN
jgi:hypothetical protein